MKRSQLNFLVDIVAFVMFVFMVVTGVIMEFLLPAGTGHSTTLWGIDRHGWGDVHFWLSIVFLAALTVHVYLHWRWIVAVLRGRPREGGSGVRVGLGVIGLVALLLIAAAPLLSPIERAEGLRGDAEPRWGLSAEAEALQGSTTLNELVRTTGVSLDVLVRELGLPSEVAPDDRLGQLAREGGVSVAEVREVVERARAGDTHEPIGEVPTPSDAIAQSDAHAGDAPESTTSGTPLADEGFHNEDHEERPNGLAEIRGSTTIGEIVELGVPLATLLRELGLPERTPLSERLGRLARTYGFTLTQVRDLTDAVR